MTKPEWIRLPEAEHRLQERFRGLLNTVMVERSVLSGEVPIRAINYASPIHIPIEKQIRPNMKVDVFLSQIQDEFGKVLWWEVEIHWPKCVDYCEQYLIPSWYTPSKGDLSTKKPPGRPTRERAERALKGLYGDQIPNRTTLPNKVLYRDVHNWLKKNEENNKNLPAISNTTILRAARRCD